MFNHLELHNRMLTKYRKRDENFQSYTKLTNKRYLCKQYSNPMMNDRPSE
jgi:iron uptake system EfeUOB component EfeO/EfeM